MCVWITWVILTKLGVGHHTRNSALWSVLFSFHLAEVVLHIFRYRFISEMDTNAIDMELLHRGIIDDGDQSKIAIEQNPNRKNQLLHACLMKKCTDDALKTVCDLIIGVAGNPRMTALGKDMMKTLEASKWCVCLFSSCECALTAGYVTCYFVVYFNWILMQPHFDILWATTESQSLVK